MLIRDKIVKRGSHCNDLSITSLEFSPEVEEIEAGAFFQCKNLRTVTIPETVKIVRQGAFASCSQLTDLSFDYGTQFEPNVFNACFNLQFLHNQGITARVFSLDSVFCYIVTLYNKKLSNDKCSIYVGRYASMDRTFPVARVDPDQSVVYVAVINKDGKEYKWFHSDLKVAVSVATFLASNQSFGEFFGIDISEHLKINKAQFNLILGGCSLTDKFWDFVTDSIGLDPADKYEIGFILSLLGDDIPCVSNRLRAMIEHKNEHFGFFDMKDTLTFQQAKKEFLQWVHNRTGKAKK